MNAIVVILLSLGAASAMPLGFQKGKRYTYSYQSEVSHAIPTGSQKTLGLRVKCQAHVDVIKKTEIQITLANVQVLQVTRNLRDSNEQKKPAEEKILQEMQKKLSLPVKVSFKPQDGSIKEMKAHPKDEEWSRNIKRGLANLFQISANIKLEEKNGKQFITESTAVGDCQVSYVINLDNSQQGQKDQVCRITKVINYEKCRRRPQFSQNTFYGRNCDGCEQSMGYAPYLRSFGQIDHTLTGSKVDGFVISRTEAFEQHVITPFSRSGGQVTASSRQILQFQKTVAVREASNEVTLSISQTCTAEDPDKSVRDDAQHQQPIAQQAQILIEEMCRAAKDPVRQQAGQKFTAVVLQLRKCNKDSLEGLVDKMLEKQDPTERKYCLDALSYVGTSEAFQVLKQKIIEDKKIRKQEELQRMLLGLASAPRPTVDHIEAVWALCEQFAASKDTANHRHCFLSFGALVHKINQLSNLQQDTKTVTACQQRIKDILDRLKNPKTSQQDRLTYIKALGNAGSAEAQQQLLDSIKDQTQPLHIRINCVWALRRIASQSRETYYIFAKLISTFADAKENPELRMAVFQLMMNCKPNFATMHTLANTVSREMTNPRQGPRSNQLASFVISYLFSLAYHSNVLVKTRSMQARLAMRVFPRMSFGLEYSKGMRWAHYSEKFQAGFEFEANKFNVPDSMLPRNMNARLQLSLLGYTMNAVEFGSRVENLDDVIEQVISKVHRRQKRSLAASFLSWLSGKDSDDDSNTEKPTGRSTRAVSQFMSNRRRATATQSVSKKKATYHRTMFRPTTRPTTRPMTTRPTYSFRQAEKHQRASVYMKLFGDEVKFAEFRQEHVDQLANDIADLLLGKKDRIEYPSLGIVISKDGVTINQNPQKAMLLANARHMLPTLAGIPLDLQLRSSAALRMNTVANVNIGPSLLSFWYFNKFNGNVEFNPSVHVHADSRIGIHTPYLRVGLWMRNTVQSDQKVSFTVESGKQYKLNYNIPQEPRDVAHVKASTQGFVEQYDPETCGRTEQQISMDLTRSHLKRVQKSCAGQDMFGVQLCAEAQVPDIASFRLQQIPVLSAFGQTDVRVSMEPSSDKPASIQLTSVVKNDEKEMQADCEISASSKTVQRRIPYKVTYRKGNQKQLEFEFKQLQVQGCEDCRMKVTANRDGLTVQFGKGQAQYQITASGQIQNQGKNLHLQAQWTELPKEWKKFFYNWQPQIWYVLQQFAWIRRTEQKTKQIAFEFQLTTPLTADLKLKTPDAEAVRTNLFLPVRVERLPQSLKDMGNYYYACCEVQDQSIKVFDHQQYQHNIKGDCLYTLVQEHRKGKQSRIQLSAKIGEQGQKTVLLSIQQQQQSKETVEVKQDYTILIDGKRQECSEKACKSMQGGAMVQKVHTSDGKTQIRLSTKLGLYVSIEGPHIQVSASPLLRSRVRGLCGDADGEQWDDYRDPQNQLQNLQKFIQSWRQQC